MWDHIADHAVIHFFGESLRQILFDDLSKFLYHFLPVSGQCSNIVGNGFIDRGHKALKIRLNKKSGTRPLLKNDFEFIIWL
jgi:hypothetical protein